jgi:REP element-mobilizing transposase RayT
MPRPIYSEIHLHITWHTKDNASVITGSIETQLHSFLRNRVLQSPGVLLHAIGGTDDHPHLAVSAPPTLLVSDWVGELKGASAYYINHHVANRRLLAWQTAMGSLALGRERSHGWCGISRTNAGITRRGRRAAASSGPHAMRRSPLKRADGQGPITAPAVKRPA